MQKKHYKTVFISDVHLGNPKNQSDKLIQFLNSISFEKLIIIWDFIDYRQLSRFWKRWKKESDTLNYINNLSKSWIKVIYIQWNHDRILKCWKEIHLENISILRDMIYTTWKWKKYYITHWDCMDWVNKDWNKMWQIWSIISWILLKIEHIWNKNVYDIKCISIAEKLEEWIKKIRMPKSKIDKKIKRFSKNIDSDWIIIWHFHLARHSTINWLDYFNTWDWFRNYGSVVENLEWNLELIEHNF